MSYKILSFDGGGIRGLGTALLIQNLDQKYGIVEKADGYAGTSTGGLIALGLASAKKIDDIVNIYEKRGEEIFQQNTRWFVEKEDGEQNILDPDGELFSGPGFSSCQYTNDGLKKIAVELLGDKTLQDSEKLLIVNSARLWNGVSWIPCTLSSKNEKYKNIKMVDAALATSAAPTYFPPYQIETLGYFADGGTFANNPSITAISEAMSTTDITDIQDVRLLSLGTGKIPEGIEPKAFGSGGRNPLRWGVTTWMWPTQWRYGGATVPATPLLNLTFDCTSQVASIQAKQILKGNYRRGNFPLKEPIALDDWKKVNELIKDTTEYLQSNEWREICQWVECNWI